MGKPARLSQERIDYVVSETDWLLGGRMSPDLIAEALKVSKLTISRYAGYAGRKDLADMFQAGRER